LTLQLETAMGEFKGLGEQVAYSKIEVEFRLQSVEAAARRTNKVSTFSWINRIGANRVATAFDHLDTRDVSARRTLAAVWPGFVEMRMPEVFLIVDRKRKELKAVTSNDARLWTRELDVAKNGSLEFWSDALVNHLVTNHSYKLVNDHVVRDRRGREGREFTFDVVSRGVPNRYLVTLFVVQRPFWSQSNALHVTEFVAPKDEFNDHVARLHESDVWKIVDRTERAELRMVRQTGRRKPMSARGQSPSESRRQ